MIKKITLSIILNLTLVFSILLPFSSGPDESVTINFNRAPLRDVLEQIRLQTNITFVYADDLVDKIKVSCSLKQVRIEEALNKLIGNTGISYKWNGSGQIILYLEKVERTFNIYGKVVDSKTGEALPYAGVLLLAGSRGTTANSEGWFSLSSLPYRNFMLNFHHIGYLDKIVTLDPEKYNGNLLIELEENALPTETVIVSELNKEIISINKDPGSLTISPSNFSDLPSIGDKDISHSLQLIPGITPGSYGASGLNIRGGLPSHNLVLLDGMTLYHTEHSFGFLNAFNPNAIKDVRLYKGAFPSKLGDRLSGVLELTAKSGDFSRFRFNSGTNQMCAQATAEIPLWGKGAILISGRRSISEYILGQLYDRVFSNIINNVVPTQKINASQSSPETYNNKSRNIYFYDFIGKATTLPGEKDILTFTFFSSLDNIKNDQSTETSLRQSAYSEYRSLASDGLYKWGSEGLSLKWYRQWNTSLNSTLHLTSSNYFVEDNLHSTDYTKWAYKKLQADSLKNLTSDSFSYTAENDHGALNNIKEMSLKNDNSFSLGDRQELGFGFSYVKYKTSFKNDDKQTDYNLKLVTTSRDTVYGSVVRNLKEFNEDAELISLYVQDTWNPLPKLNAELGLRAVSFSLTRQTAFDPRVSLNYEFYRNLVLKAAWGKYHQFILQCGDDFQNWYENREWLLADGAGIEPASAEHTAAGLKYENDDFLIDFEMFTKNMSNVIERENRTAKYLADKSVDTSSVGFLQHNENIRGADFLFQKKTGSLNGWISYSFSSAEAEYKGYSYTSLQDVPHNLNIVLNYFYNNWTLSAAWQYSSGRPVVAPDMITVQKYIYLSYDPQKRNIERLPSNHRLNLSLTGKFNFESFSLKAGVSVFNLYDQKNIWYRYFTIKNNAVNPVDIYMLGITPTVFVELQL